MKTILILGGTGFIGRAVTEKYLKNGWRVIIITRAINLNEAKKKLILHGLDKYNLEKYIKENRILFVFNINIIDTKWLQINNWQKLFNNLNVNILNLLEVINLIGETSKSNDEISKSNFDALNGIFIFVQYLKSQNKNSIFCNMGSTAEKDQNKNLAPYQKAKIAARQKINGSNLCDYHFIVNYVKGKGEQKMKIAAPYLWSKLKFSRRWLFGFKISIIDVDDLAEIIYRIYTINTSLSSSHKPIEVNVTNGELLFGEMIKNLLPENERAMPKLIIPKWFEKYFLQLYSFIIPWTRPNNQLSRRLANFAKKGSMNLAKQEILRAFKTAQEIKKMASDAINYLVLEINPNLIIINKHHPIIYALREKSNDELKQIVQKAIITPD